MLSFIYLSSGCFIVLFIVYRLIQRLYYCLRGHKHYGTYSPRTEINNIFQQLNVPIIECSTKSTIDNIPIYHRQIGTGSKFLLFLNGVGTDFFMWLPIIQFIILIDPTFFEKYTMIAQPFRGLFATDTIDDGTGNVERVKVTLRNCIQDVQDVLLQIGIKQYDTILGWSTGAQVAVACVSMHPDTARKLFLLNVPLGNTLHTTFQPFIPLPIALQKRLSSILLWALQEIRPVVESSLWDLLRAVAHASTFRVFYEVIGVFNGFPPAQAAYFYEYTKDIFMSRAHTHALLDLIEMVDESLPLRGEMLAEALSHLDKCVIISGVFDIITGVYHSQELHSLLSKSLLHNKVNPLHSNDNIYDTAENNIIHKERIAVAGSTSTTTTASRVQSEHVCFSMGTHFLLLEWPDLLAQLLIQTLQQQSGAAAVVVVPAVTAATAAKELQVCTATFHSATTSLPTTTTTGTPPPLPTAGTTAAGANDNSTLYTPSQQDAAPIYASSQAAETGREKDRSLPTATDVTGSNITGMSTRSSVRRRRNLNGIEYFRVVGDGS